MRDLLFVECNINLPVWLLFPFVSSTFSQSVYVKVRYVHAENI